MLALLHDGNLLSNFILCASDIVDELNMVGGRGKMRLLPKFRQLVLTRILSPDGLDSLMIVGYI